MDMQSILGMATTTHLIALPYDAGVQETDSYPSLALRFLVDGDLITFFSTAQGEGYRPWGAIYRGQTVTITDDIPYQVLLRLRLYMQKDVEKALEDACLQEQRTRTP